MISVDCRFEAPQRVDGEGAAGEQPAGRRALLVSGQTRRRWRGLSGGSSASSVAPSVAIFPRSRARIACYLYLSPRSVAMAPVVPSTLASNSARLRTTTR